MSDLVLETRGQSDQPPIRTPAGLVMITPAIDEDYWSYRVQLSETQAVLGFPKFGVVGIGFAEEVDWNTNLPSSVPAEEIYSHIARNKGDDSISDEDVLRAIKIIQAAVARDREAGTSDWKGKDHGSYTN